MLCGTAAEHVRRCESAKVSSMEIGLGRGAGFQPAQVPGTFFRGEKRYLVPFSSVAVFLISAAALGLELVLVRALSIGHWHHLAFLVISTALLGFGAGGTFVSIGSAALAVRRDKAMWFFAAGLGVSVPVVFWASQRLPLDELLLIWDWRQPVYLFGYYLLCFVPFFFAGLFISLAFTAFSAASHRLYFFNMAGSGAGVAVFLVLMYGNPPERLLLLVSSMAFASAALLAPAVARHLTSATVLAAIAVVSAFGLWRPLELEVKINENKALAYYRALPDAETLAVCYSPLARLDCITAPAIRHFPGLGIGYSGRLPPQVLVIADADGVSAVNSFSELGDVACYDNMTSALAYHLAPRAGACVVGSGGGSDVCQALACGAEHVLAVEIDPRMISLVRDRLARFSSGIYDRSDVDIVVADGRSFLQSSAGGFDVIAVSMLDTFSAAAAGFRALNESHLYTVESVELALSRLAEDGILSITRLLKVPPTDAVKILATVAEALERRGVRHPARHVIMVRNWATATIVASPRPFEQSRIEKARRFAAERLFDIVHLPGVKLSQVNRFHVLEEPLYYQAAQRMLSGDRKAFYRDYAYNVVPATDDRPYFFDFFRWRAVPHMIRTMSGRWLAYSQWGYLVLAATLIQAVLAAAVLIFLPLLITSPLKAAAGPRLPHLAYFGLVGLAYMFVEMGFIQKLTLLIGHPIFGVAVALSGFLVFSGFGSLVAGKLSLGLRPAAVVWLGVGATIAIGVVEILVLNSFFSGFVGLGRPVRITLAFAFAALPAFFMGMPFPTALLHLGRSSPALVPWAWAVNGCAGVTAAVLGVMLAMSFGFTALILIALACYLTGAMIMSIL